MGAAAGGLPARRALPVGSWLGEGLAAALALALIAAECAKAWGLSKGSGPKAGPAARCQEVTGSRELGQGVLVAGLS